MLPIDGTIVGSIALSEVEVRAVIAYLQDLGGVEVTVEIPTEAVEEEVVGVEGELHHEVVEPDVLNGRERVVLRHRPGNLEE